MTREDQFLVVLEAHKGILYKVANSYCNNADDRKDLVQEIIYQLWRSFGNYNPAFQYSTWIYRIALNVAVSFYRKARSRSTLSQSFSEALLDLKEPATPDEHADTDLGILQREIARLKDLDKALILLYLEEKSYKEIAGIIGISETNVATRLSRIKNTLKQNMIQTQQQ